jgi:hypothetical protein
VSRSSRLDGFAAALVVRHREARVVAAAQRAAATDEDFVLRRLHANDVTFDNRPKPH